MTLRDDIRETILAEAMMWLSTAAALHFGTSGSERNDTDRIEWVMQLGYRRRLGDKTLRFQGRVFGIKYSVGWGCAVPSTKNGKQVLHLEASS